MFSAARLCEVVPPQLTSNRNRRRAGRAWAVAGALFVLAIGGFVTLALLWWASFNYEPWEPTPSDRRRILIWATCMFALTVGAAGAILWRGFRARDEDRLR